MQLRYSNGITAIGVFCWQTNAQNQPKVYVSLIDSSSSSLPKNKKISCDFLRTAFTSVQYDRYGAIIVAGRSGLVVACQVSVREIRD